MDEKMRALDTYIQSLKLKGEGLPSYVEGKRPHFHAISAASGVDFTFLTKEPYRQRVMLAVDEVGLTTKEGTKEERREARFHRNRILLTNYFEWLKANGFKLPEDPLRRGKVFFAQLIIEAGLSLGAITLQKTKGEHSYEPFLHRQVEEAYKSLGTEVRVLPQYPGRQQQSLTYDEVLNKGTAERKVELRDKPSADPQLYNTRSALNRFLKTLGIQKASPIGAEFVTGFKSSAEKVMAGIANARSRKKFQTEIQWWRDCYQRLVKEPLIPDDLSHALVHLIDRSGLSISVLARLIGASKKSLWTWYKGIYAPSAVNLTALIRMETLFKLPAGTLTEKITGKDRSKRFRLSELPHFLRQDHKLLRRVRKHLPDNFCSLTLEHQGQMVESIDAEIVHGQDAYDKKIQELTRLPYRLEVWPEQLWQEFDDYAKFKMAERPPIGMSRNGRWRLTTRKMYEGNFRRLFGALQLPIENEDARLRGLGLPESHLTLALVACPLIIDWYIRFQCGTRAHYTEYAAVLLQHFLSMLRGGTGWLRQNPQLALRLREVRLETLDLVPQDLVVRAQTDWDGVCDAAIRRYEQLISEIKPLTIIARDPFRRIEGIVNMDDPMEAAEHLITGMGKNLPSNHTQPVLYHTAVRNRAIVVLIAMTGLRRNTVAQLDYLGDKRGHLYKEDKNYILSIPRKLFKEEDSPFFGPKQDQKDYFMELPDTFGSYEVLDEYLNVSRPFLMERYHGRCKEQPLFVTSAWAKLKMSNEGSARLNPQAISHIYTAATELHLAENKWRGTGLAGARKHGPHSMRHIRGTKAVKETGSFQVAADANHNSEGTARKHYARFIPRNRNRRVNKVLFRKVDEDNEDEE
jgi:hypothetical protein